MSKLPKVRSRAKAKVARSPSKASRTPSKVSEEMLGKLRKASGEADLLMLTARQANADYESKAAERDALLVKVAIGEKKPSRAISVCLTCGQINRAGEECPVCKTP